jgi:exo-beta-1,3-glucanase (GH17 family)
MVMLGGCMSKNPEGPVAVEIVPLDDGGYQLLRGGEPYVIRGAGMAIDDTERFAAYGGNSIRTWTTQGEEQDTRALLDAAYANGVTVSLCLTVMAERWGFDYDDADAVAAQLEDMRAEVLKYKDHPALLAWIIGNELNHEAENPAVYDAVNELSKMIHEVDPHHPTTTAISGMNKDTVALVMERAPDLDFLSFQLYGSLFALPEMLAESGFDGPYMVTEWGSLGYWEMASTTWGAPVELTSTEKAGIFRRGYQEILSQAGPQLIGSYVFKWGQKQERTPTWFGLFLESGEETEAVDVMRELWTGEPPPNRSPQVVAMSVAGGRAPDSVELNEGQEYEAVFDVTDPDGDPLRYRWELKPESEATVTGGDFEDAISNVRGWLSDTESAATMLTAPPPGRYRVFAYAFDDHGHAAHANVPVRVPVSLGQAVDDLVAGETMAVAYSGFREGQHPDRGDGAVNPSDEEILEDLRLLIQSGFRLIRLYDTGENSGRTLELIRAHDLPLKVLLGIWLDAEVSNHEGCPWLDEPIPETELAANRIKNAAAVDRGVELALQFADIVVAVNVGNEALVEWNDHMVTLDAVIDYVRTVREAIAQPVTVADNYDWWARHGAPLAKEVDFIGIHTYPVWEGRDIDEGLPYTLDNLQRVRDALPDKSYAILEAGWATVATEFGERANEASQVRYYDELGAWAAENHVTVFFFEAFDEPWKGNPNNPLGAEKHWGLFNVDRTPKAVMRPR